MKKLIYGIANYITGKNFSCNQKPTKQQLDDTYTRISLRVQIKDEDNENVIVLVECGETVSVEIDGRTVCKGTCVGGYFYGKKQTPPDISSSDLLYRFKLDKDGLIKRADKHGDSEYF